MLRRLGPGRSALAGPVRGLLERSVQSRAFPLARWPMLRVPGRDPGADSIETHLAQCFGTRSASASCSAPGASTRSRCSRSSTSTAGCSGYAKVGHNELTAALVRREAAALARSAAQDPGRSGCPQLHRPRPVGRPRGPRDVTPRRRAAVPATSRASHGSNAMREVAALTGPLRRDVARERLLDSACGTTSSGCRPSGPAPDSRLGRDGRAAPRRATRCDSAAGTATGAAGTWASATASSRSGTGSATTPRCRWASTPPLRGPGDPAGPSVTLRQPGEGRSWAWRRRACAELGVPPAEHDLTLRSTC